MTRLWKVQVPMKWPGPTRTGSLHHGFHITIIVVLQMQSTLVYSGINNGLGLKGLGP